MSIPIPDPFDPCPGDPGAESPLEADPARGSGEVRRGSAFDAVDAADASFTEITRPRRARSQSAPRPAATAVSAVVLILAVLGGFYGLIWTGLTQLAGVEIDKRGLEVDSFGLVSGDLTVDYSGLVIFVGFLLAWLAGAAAGGVALYRLRGSWSALLAPVAAFVVFIALMLLTVVAYATYVRTVLDT